MANEKPVKVTLEIIPQGKRCLLTVTGEEEEELVRAAAKHVRQLFRLYRNRFSEQYVPDLEIMSMIAVDIATNRLQLEKENDTGIYAAKIQQYNDVLKAYLQER